MEKVKLGSQEMDTKRKRYLKKIVLDSLKNTEQVATYLFPCSTVTTANGDVGPPE